MKIQFCIQDELLRWWFIKENFPKTAKNLLNEYHRTNGFIPYEQGYVYLIHAVGTNYYKIGKTINPDKRILQIAPKMPFLVKYKRVWPSNFMSYAERYLHNRLEDYRANGEWFEFTPETYFNCNFDFGPTSDMIRGAYSIHFHGLFDREEISSIPSLGYYVDVVFDPQKYSGCTTIGTVERFFCDISFELNNTIQTQHEMV